MSDRDLDRLIQTYHGELRTAWSAFHPHGDPHAYMGEAEGGSHPIVSALRDLFGVGVAAEVEVVIEGLRDQVARRGEEVDLLVDERRLWIDFAAWATDRHVAERRSMLDLITKRAMTLSYFRDEIQAALVKLGSSATKAEVAEVLRKALSVAEADSAT